MQRNLFKKLFLLTFLLLMSCSNLADESHAETQEDAAPSSNASYKLVQSKCTSCHSFTQVSSQKRTLPQWVQVVEDMILKGAKINDSEFEEIVFFLSDEYSPD